MLECGCMVTDWVEWACLEGGWTLGPLAGTVGSVRGLFAALLLCVAGLLPSSCEAVPVGATGLNLGTVAGWVVG